MDSYAVEGLSRGRVGLVKNEMLGGLGDGLVCRYGWKDGGRKGCLSGGYFEGPAIGQFLWD